MAEMSEDMNLLLKCVVGIYAGSNSAQTAGTIIINGGKFKNHVPGREQTGEGIVVADGVSVYYMDGYVPDGMDANTSLTTSHDKNAAAWYEVR